MVRKSEKLVCAYLLLIGAKFDGSFEMRNLLFTAQELIDKANETFGENIKSIEFVIGSFDSYRPKRVYHFINDRVRCEEDYDGFSFEVEKQDFIDKLRDIHIGEWYKEYSTERYNIIVLDGIQWELSICYDNSHKPITICGDNAYPYNFKDLLWLLGINPSIIADGVEDDDETFVD